ncbi:hypothetical protein NCU05388 [Neurospora crassa OR74A]|uniref:Uncharacterized protein n=1 Tax=Neurospora crassa (strain ATCC 24698 / 74-OR23-1A / CBS 708.71 / DSM 1257 / FGSC 987) TaxID=367110 RepID=Q7SCB6_NEUCR|nr:hypothetical protein NCU05388 [Neurospora crassa OR74A]EAA34240.3 hypothetical protein NCU05388 [Neurospora crassa OR74A]|eukprot:XP_963476.3 hypothetical protein NCU05388 [Neurospora crassa OR74A]
MPDQQFVLTTWSVFLHTFSFYKEDDPDLVLAGQIETQFGLMTWFKDKTSVTASLTSTTTDETPDQPPQTGPNPAPLRPRPKLRKRCGSNTVICSGKHGADVPVCETLVRGVFPVQSQMIPEDNDHRSVCLELWLGELDGSGPDGGDDEDEDSQDGVGQDDVFAAIRRHNMTTQRSKRGIHRIKYPVTSAYKDILEELEQAQGSETQTADVLMKWFKICHGINDFPPGEEPLPGQYKCKFCYQDLTQVHKAHEHVHSCAKTNELGIQKSFSKLSAR